MNIAFIGYRCSGKTTIAKLLSEAINYKKIELDHEIEKYFNMTIPTIVNHYGWDVFRRCEKTLIKKYSKKDFHILDLGGGAILDKANMTKIKKNSLVFFLECPAQQIITRLKKSYHRPGLTSLSLEQEVETVLKERHPLYKKYADYCINTGYFTMNESLTIINTILSAGQNVQENYTLKPGYLFA